MKDTTCNDIPSAQEIERAPLGFRRSMTQKVAPMASKNRGRSKARRWRVALRELMDEPGSSWAAGGVFSVIISAILASVMAFFLSSVQSLTTPDNGHTIWVLEACCVSIFTLEVVLRTTVATLDVKNLLLLDAYYWVDLLAIIPFYLDLLVTLPPAWRWLQLLRLLRILKLLRHCTRALDSSCLLRVFSAMRMRMRAALCATSRTHRLSPPCRGS